MSEQKHYAWQDGLPTSPDVEALMTQWPDLKVGDRVGYEEIGELLHLDWHQRGRFQTVTNAWRKRWREKNIIIECDPGASFYVASAGQIGAGTYGVLKTIGRRAKVQRRKLAAAATQPGADCAVIDHQAKLMHAVERDTRKHRMNLLPTTASTERPRIAPPAKKKA